MSARIDVLQGPDSGRRFLVTAGEVRIGRGPGNQIKLEDPTWEGGCLLLQFRQGGYLVTNQMPHSVYIDRKVLEPGKQWTGYAGAWLQPSKATVLRLEVVDNVSGHTSDPSGVAELAPEKPPRSSWMTSVLLAVGLGVAGAVLLPSAGALPGSGDQPAVALSLYEKLGEWDGEQRWAFLVRRLRHSLQDAAFQESGKRPELACQRYQEARSVLLELRKVIPEQEQTGSLGDTLAAVDRLIYRQMIRLAGR